MSTQINVKVAVLCHNSNGEPEFFLTNVTTSPEECNDGDHYTIALEQASAAGFDPVMCFDGNDQAARQLADTSAWFAQA